MAAFLLALGVAVSASLLAPVAYAAAFAVAAVVTAHRRSRPDPLAAELDAFLDEVLGRPVPAAPSAPSGSRRAEHRR